MLRYSDMAHQEGGSMSEQIIVEQGGLNAIFVIGEDKQVYFLHFSSQPFREEDILDYQKEKFVLVQLQAAGLDHNEHHGSKHTGTMPGTVLKYRAHEDILNELGRKLVFHLVSEGIQVDSHIQFYDHVSVARFWNVVTNTGAEPVTIEYISTFALTGCGKEGLQTWDEKMLLHVPHNTWGGEVQWRTNSLRQLGLSRVEGTSAVSDPQSSQNFSMKRVCMTSNGTWGCSEYLPMGCLENTESAGCITWQIEHHSAWHCEVSDNLGQLYLQLSGPTENEHQWCRTLLKGERFETVKAAVAAGESFEDTICELTKYRRLIRRQNTDNEKLPVIFNDYMNCLYGDPTTKKLLPLIDAAAEAGCEYFCIDAGWYADGTWWDEVGEWLPSKRRFPNGIEEPLKYIYKKGMVPGLWLELEVMGVNCPLADKLPDDWFFLRHGKRVIDHGRYQLDYRSPEVREYASSIIKRLVEEYGVGYIKMDYNINAGIGTEYRSNSVGDGLLEHCRAYLKWLEATFEKYSELVIENCSSGGMRMAYSLLELQSIQSTSDQIDYKRYASIAAAAAAAVTPEQAAVWAYPTTAGDMEETAFNMINAMLFRIHQSGHLANISRERFRLVQEGIRIYKNIRQEIKTGLPFWPLGLGCFEEEWLSFGMQLQTSPKAYLAVWHVKPGKDCIVLPLKKWKGKDLGINFLYPVTLPCEFRWNKVSGNLTLKLPNSTCARLLEITPR